MRRRPALRPQPPGDAWKLERFSVPDLGRYYSVFHRVGDEHLWVARLLLPQSELARYITADGVEVFILTTQSGDEGLLELDFRVSGECEVALFGVAPSLVGTGAGRWFMNRALEIAWSRPIERFWLHTCTLDHPNALAFYTRTGFVPYQRQVEVFDDPRYLKLTRADAAPHVPIL
ncbi:MAG: GNAT family N-acetyltransferase [Candidatus Eremiobacteraeota bacterium]|nr:GNAT family N-acetyltransferase [Candidatus Eremiobacteraeota bacterium]